MAKVTFTKLGLKTNKDIKTIIWNDQEIEIKQYLPVNEKMDLITRIINNSSSDDMKFYNVGKIKVFTALEMIITYSNISFTEKQREDAGKLFDLIVSSGLYNEIMQCIPAEEYEWIVTVTNDSIKSIYEYQNSVMGILDTVSQDYSGLDYDATALQQKIADPENLELLKGIMTRLG